MKYLQLSTSIPHYGCVSISGGIDSIAAAYVCHTEFRVSKAYHFNHRLRPQNDEMERKVKAFCDKFKIELIVKRADKKLQTEAECREARVGSFFNAIGGTLITAHHLDDAVESYLLNCFRGHPEYLPIPRSSKYPTGTILHPFLLYQKEDFVKIARQNGLMQYIVEDETNKEVKGSRRNFIRQQIVPLLKEQQLGLNTIVKKRYNNIFGYESR
jgi:tRNA(Ile)-lysidine synthetase-like protein